MNPSGGVKLFTVLRNIRGHERKHLPALMSLVDFDIVVEIGYAEETGRPLTAGALDGLKLTSRTSLHRRLKALLEAGVLGKEKMATDKRCTIFVVRPRTLAALHHYAAMLTEVASAIKDITPAYV